MNCHYFEHYLCFKTFWDWFQQKLKVSKAAASQIMAWILNKPRLDCFGITATLPCNGANCGGLALTRFPSLSLYHFQIEQSRIHQCFPCVPSWCVTPFGLGVPGLEYTVTRASHSPASPWNNYVIWHGPRCTTSCRVWETGSVHVCHRWY